MNIEKIWAVPSGRKKSALNYPKIWANHVEIINHMQPITIKSVFLNSFLIENKCLINLEHINLGTQEMSSREWPIWYGTPHAACAPSQRLTKNNQHKGQWMWWVGKKSTDIYLKKKKKRSLFHCRALNITGALKWSRHPICYFFFQMHLLSWYLSGNVFTVIVKKKEKSLLQLHLTVCPHNAFWANVSLLCPWYKWLKRGTVTSEQL